MRLHRNRRQGGVTLIELMLVVGLIAVLGAVAIPSYRNYAQRAQRSEASAALLRLAANQERFYLTANTYTTNVALLGFATGQTETGLYAINVNPANAATFTATATPVLGAGQAADARCQSFGINSAGVRTSAPGPVDECWAGR